MQSIQAGIVVEMPDLAASNKKSAIRVLHVDDDSSLLEISKQIMMDMDASLEFDSINSVDEAFKKLSIGQYDVVISDYEMPQKNGLQFLKELREQKNQIPFILFTGKGREEVAINALNLGANRYINKNGDPETVYTELASSVTQAAEHLRTQSLLQHSEERFSLLSGATFEGIGFSEEGKIVDSNNQLEKMVGYNHSELLGLKVIDLLAPESRDFVQSRIKSGDEGPYECLLVKKDGSVLPVEIRAKNIFRRGKIERVCAIRDLSEHKTAERTLEESEEKYKNLFENAPDIILTIDLVGKVTSANKAIIKHGFKENEFVGKSALELVPVEYQQKMFASLKNISAGNPAQDEIEMLTPKGKRNVEYNSSPIWLNGKVVGYQTVLRDVTERKNAEEKLKDSEEFYRLLYEKSHDAILIIEPPNWNFTAGNPAALKMFAAKSDKEFTSHSPFDLSPEYQSDGRLSNEKALEMIKDALEKGFNFFNWTHKRLNGQEFDAEVLLIRIKLRGKQAFQATVREITEQKKAEDALRQERDMLESVTAASGAGLVIVGKDYRVQWANDFIKRYKGDTIGKLCYASLNSLDSPCPDCGVAKIFAGKTLLDSHEYCSTTIDGNPYWVEIVATPLTDENGNIISAVEICVDITERKNAEGKLRESQYLTQKILDCSPNLIYIYDLQGKRNVYANRETFDFLGYTPEQVKSMGSELFANILHPDDAELVAKHHALFLNAADNATYDVEYRLKNSNGEWRWVRSRDTLFARTKDGLGKQILGICEDITESKKAEEEADHMVDQLVLVNEKLGVVGSLTRHDARNKLSAVSGYAYLLKKKHGDKTDVVEAASRIEQAVKEIAEIFDFAKIYEQIGAEELTYINVDEKLDEAAALFSGLISTITNECQGLAVLADPFLRQLFLNFIDNTRKYGKKTTTIRVYFEKADQGCLKLVYEDDGVGVSFENKPHLFKEGFSTGGSTGFGLFLIKKMIDVYGWTITEEGEPGKGVKFTITIPKLNKSGKENYQIVP
jgi:PAS domain S-box-containing protein